MNNIVTKWIKILEYKGGDHVPVKQENYKQCANEFDAKEAECKQILEDWNPHTWWALFHKIEESLPAERADEFRKLHNDQWEFELHNKPTMKELFTPEMIAIRNKYI